MFATTTSLAPKPAQTGLSWLVACLVAQRQAADKKVTRQPPVGKKT